MFRVSYMDEAMDFQNFNDVWARVTERADIDAPPISAEIKPEEKICVIKRCEKSRAVRFIPEI